MKSPDCIETALMTAFRMASTNLAKAPGKTGRACLPGRVRHSTKGAKRVDASFGYAELSTLRNPGR
jgi:hypothetical protein